MMGSRCSLPRTGSTDRGSISAFVAGLVIVFIACAALVVDGGRFVAARSNAADAAENAARAGAQEVRRLREGILEVDPDRAAARARAFLTESGFTGTASADTLRVTVTVTGSVAPVLLGVFGVSTRVISVTRSATPFDR
jgi:Flp pilus assembly protein TadG